MDIASLGFRVDSRDLQKGNKELSQMERNAKSVNRATNTLAAGFRRLTPIIGAFAAAFGASASLGAFVTNTIEAQRVQAQLAAALKSTGAAAGQTIQSLNDHAAALQKVTNYGDETINRAQGMLLTFTNIGGDTFPRATQAILDLSTAMDQDLRSSVVQLGKVLNDPVANLGALARTGIQFSDAQKDLIKELANTNRLAEAQSVILDELERQFGGSAEAARNTLGGALKSLGNAWGDLFELSDKATDGLRQSIEELITKISDPAFAQFVNMIGTRMVNAISALVDAINSATFSNFIAQLDNVISKVETLIGWLAKVANLGGIESLGGIKFNGNDLVNFDEMFSDDTEGPTKLPRIIVGGETSDFDTSRFGGDEESTFADFGEKLPGINESIAEMNGLLAGSIEGFEGLDSSAGRAISTMTGTSAANEDSQDMFAKGDALTEDVQAGNPFMQTLDYLDELNLMLEEGAISWQTYNAAAVQAMAGISATVLGLAGQVAGAFSQMFEDNKGWALATAVINTAAAVMQALASYPPPISYAYAAAAAATGAAQIAQIASSSQNTTSYSAGSSAGNSGAAHWDSLRQAQPAQQGQVVNLTLQGQDQTYSRDQLEGLVNQINDLQQDGGPHIVIRSDE